MSASSPTTTNIPTTTTTLTTTTTGAATTLTATSCETTTVTVEKDRPGPRIEPEPEPEPSHQTGTEPGPRHQPGSDSSSSQPCQATPSLLQSLQLCSLLGCVLLVIPNCTRWIWGNLTVYVSSYLYARGGHDPSEVNTPWMLSIYSGAWTVGVFASGLFVRQLGRTNTNLLGVFLIDLGVLLSYVSIRANSVAALNLTLGGVTALGDGVVSTVVILLVSDWAGKYQGLMISLAFSGNILGSVPLNQFVTMYINPENLQPDLEVPPSKFFTQPSMLERTPELFLLLLAICAGFQALGLTLIRLQGKATVIRRWFSFSLPSKSSPHRRCRCCCIGKSLTESAYEKLSLTSSGNHRQSSYADKENKKENKSESDSLVDSGRISGGCGGSSSGSEIDDHKHSGCSSSDKAAGLSPLQVLRTCSFHALWIGFSLSELPKIWLLDYYKIFGMRRIDDDHFLTDLGTAMAVLSAFSRSFWGWSTDSLGIKTTMVVCSAALTVINALFYFAPLGGRWAYALSVLTFSSAVNGHTIITSVATVRWYGRKYLAANYGLICLASCLTNLVAPLLFQSFLDSWGWFQLLLTIAGLNLVATLVIIALVPTDSS